MQRLTLRHEVAAVYQEGAIQAGWNLAPGDPTSREVEDEATMGALDNLESNLSNGKTWPLLTSIETISMR
jgi:hypothetical protein